MKKLEKGRDDDSNIYQDFLQITLGYIVGTSKWKTMKEKTTTIMDSREEFDTEQKFHDALLSNKCWTDSDEAFAITILANNLDIWIKKHKQKTEQAPNMSKNKPLHDSQKYMDET